MREYKKPVVLMNEELSEGVYAASGEISWTPESQHWINVRGVEEGQTVRLVFVGLPSREVVYDGSGRIYMTEEEEDQFRQGIATMELV